MIWADPNFLASEANPINAPVISIRIGNYDVPDSHLLDAGSVRFSRGYRFDSGIASTEISFKLNNASGIYSPRMAEFLFFGTTWYRKPVKVWFGYKRAVASPVVDKILVFDGVVMTWGPVVKMKGPGPSDPIQEESVTIVCRDRVSLFLDRKVGVPDAEGAANPLIYGTVVKDALPLNDTILWTPDDTADFETGDLSELTSTTENGDGTFAISTTDPYEGTYCVRAEVETNNDDAYGEIDLGSGQADLLFSVKLKFDTIPSAPANLGLTFLLLRNSAGSNLAALVVLSGGDVRFAHYGKGTNHDTGWNIFATQGRWVRVSIGSNVYSPGVFKVYLDGAEICSYQSNFTQTPRYCRLGLSLGALFSENYVVYYDDVQISETYYGEGHYLPGYPFTSIDGAFSDGTIIPQHGRRKRFRGGLLAKPFRLRFRGRQVTSDSYSTDADYGIVAFNNYENPPDGSIFIKATKNATTHPADMISGLLAEGELDAYEDVDSFAATKAATPNYELGAWFENTTIADAVQEICLSCLYDIIPGPEKIGLKAYLGNEIRSYVKTLGESDLISFQQSIEQEDLKNSIVVKRGWWEYYDRLLYRVQDADLIALLGEMEVELDFTWGQTLMTDAETMCQEIGDALLTRLKAPIDTLRVSCPLSFARLELGDGVLVTYEDFFAYPVIYEVFEKNINASPGRWGVDLTLVRFIGEEAG